MWTLNPTNNLLSNLDSIWENSWMTCKSHNMLAPFTMQGGRREIPQSAEVQEQKLSLQKLPVGSQLIDAGSKINLSNLQGKQTKLIKST